MKFDFIIILILILIVFYFTNIKIIDTFNFDVSNQNPDLILTNKKMFTLTTLIQDPNIVQHPDISTEANLVYHDNNFYITNQPKYIFSGIAVSNNIIKLQNTNGIEDLILNFNTTNTSDSKIILLNDNTDILNENSNTIQNIFNKTNKNIYFNLENKTIFSNDLDGNLVYLTLLYIDYPVDWNYNLDNGVVFNIEYI